MPKFAASMMFLCAAVVTACGSGDDNPGTGRSGGNGGVQGNNIAGAKGEGGAGGEFTIGADGFPAECIENPPPPSAAQQSITFQVTPQLNGKSLVFGEPNPLASGGTLMPTNLRFFLSG